MVGDPLLYIISATSDGLDLPVSSHGKGELGLLSILVATQTSPNVFTLIPTNQADWNDRGCLMFVTRLYTGTKVQFGIFNFNPLGV